MIKIFLIILGIYLIYYIFIRTVFITLYENYIERKVLKAIYLFPNSPHELFDSANKMLKLIEERNKLDDESVEIFKEGHLSNFLTNYDSQKKCLALNDDLNDFKERYKKEKDNFNKLYKYRKK